MTKFVVIYTHGDYDDYSQSSVAVCNSRTEAELFIEDIVNNPDKYKEDLNYSHFMRKVSPDIRDGFFHAYHFSILELPVWTVD